VGQIRRPGAGSSCGAGPITEPPSQRRCRSGTVHRCAAARVDAPRNRFRRRKKSCDFAAFPHHRLTSHAWHHALHCRSTPRAACLSIGDGHAMRGDGEVRARPSPNASTCRLPSACSDEPSGAQSVFQSVAKRIATSVLLLSQVLVLRAAAGVCSARRLHARNAGHRPHRPLPRVARHRDRGHDLIGGRRSHVAIKRRIP